MITVVQDNDIYKIHFHYDANIVELVKEVPGRRFDGVNKYWTIPKDRLGFLLDKFKGTPYEHLVDVYNNENISENATLDATTNIPDIDISDVDHYVESGSKLFPHQLDFLKYAIDKQNHNDFSGFILADQMGCISGKCKVVIKEIGKPSTRKVTLQTLYKLFQKDSTIQIKCMINGRFGYLPIKTVAYKGKKSTVNIKLEDTEITCTSDHLIYSEYGWKAAEDLIVGDSVFTNGKLVCPKCGTDKDLISYKYSKFFGYCKSCMYSERNGCKYKDAEIVRIIDKFGYVRLRGKSTRTMPNYQKLGPTGGIYEHHQVWYENTGHIVDTTKEVVHHKNGIKTDNRIENLELLSIHDHNKLHCDTKTNHLYQFNENLDFVVRGDTKIYLVPRLQKITKIESDISQDVYDVEIDSPDIHNYICNNIIVHNCGKTVEVLNLALYNRKRYGIQHCLIIVCLNSAKYNWASEITKHTNGQETPYILGSRIKRDGTINTDTSSADKLKDLMTGKMYGKEKGELLPFFIIMNIEAIRFKQQRHFAIREQLSLLCNNDYIGMIAVDEIHRNASAQSQNGRQLLELKKSLRVPVEWIPMTGTPIVNKPTDVYVPLKLVDGHHFTSFYKWQQNFCVFGGFGDHEVLTYKNIPELKEWLQGKMLRRLKKDVLDLPEKLHTIEYVDNTPYQMQLYRTIVVDMLAHSEEIKASSNPAVKFLRLRQVNGCPELVDTELKVNKDYLAKNAKLQRLLELVVSIVENGEKVVIFSNWVETLRTIYRFLASRYKVCVFTGTMKQQDREAHKQKFINDPNYMILMGTTEALGVSHTLTVAHNVIFYDEPWNYAKFEQAEDRCHRAGTTSTVNVYSLITRDTVDDKVHNMIMTKDGISKYIVDGQLDFKNNPQLVEILLGKLK